MSFLSVEGLSVRFGGVHAVSDVSFALDQGGVTGLIGPNGAGKTTLINSISGLVPISAGRITLDGVRLRGLRPHRIARAGLGRAFQHSELMQGETVLENIVAGATLNRPFSILGCLLALPSTRRSERAARDDARDFLDRLGIGNLATATPDSLPYGTAKKIDIARALIGRPKLLLLDEPTAGLSAEEADEIVSLCLAVSRDVGTTILLIEHNMRIVMSTCRHLIVLDHGRKLAEGTPAAVAANQAVIDAYLGEDQADA